MDFELGSSVHKLKALIGKLQRRTAKLEKEVVSKYEEIDLEPEKR
jgi:hypothetical protein